MLAEIISSWHQDELRKKMKAKGIKFSPRPVAGPLLAFPCQWMLLSCVMLSMWSVAMAGPVLQPTPVTWVTAFGCVRFLGHNPWTGHNGVGEINQLKPVPCDDDDWSDFTICRPCEAKVETAKAPTK